MQSLIDRLKLTHARLEAEIGRELDMRSPDQSRVSRLKKVRLAIKDRLYGTARRSLSVR